MEKMFELIPSNLADSFAWNTMLQAFIAEGNMEAFEKYKSRLFSEHPGQVDSVTYTILLGKQDEPVGAIFTAQFPDLDLFEILSQHQKIIV